MSDDLAAGRSGLATLAARRVSRRSLLAGMAAAPAVLRGSGIARAQNADTVVVAIGGDPSSLDPLAVEDGNERAVNDSVYEPLVTRDSAEQIVPLLATAWTQQDPTTWRFTLKQGVTFHNGEPFNADAAVFSLKRVIDPAFKSQFAANIATIADAVKVDDATFDLKTNVPDPSLLARLTTLRMMAPQWTQSAGDQVNSTTNGTGPYKVTTWKRGVEIDLEANASYWGGAPAIAKAVVRIIPEDQTRLSALQAGEVDLVRGLLPEQLAQAPAVASALGPTYSFIRLSTLGNSPVADKRVRQALNYAVDKEALLSQLYGGQGSVLPGQLAGPEMFGFNPNLQPYPYDPDKAKSLLAEANAQNLELEIISPQGRWTADGLRAQAIGGMLEQVGLKVKVTLINFDQWIKQADRSQTPNTPAVMNFQTENPLFDADRTVTGYYTDVSSFSAYKNAQLDPLIEQARSELDTTKREQLYQQIFEIGREDPPAIFLLQLADTWGMSKRLTWKPVPDGRTLFKDMTIS